MMDVHIVVGTTEGFTSSVGISIDGVIFKTVNLHWIGIEAKQKAIRTLTNFVNQLKIAGFTIIGEELLDKLNR
jgi:hypothetical protein